MSERCKHGLDGRFCSLCNAPRPTSRGGPKKRSARRATTPAVHYLDHRFDNDGRTLVVTADLVKGWRSERRSPDAEPMKTYCFSEVADAEWQGGAIHIQVSVFPRPGGLTTEWSPPPLLNWSGRRERHMLGAYDEKTGEDEIELVEDCFDIQASDGALVITVDLLNEHGAKPHFFSLRSNRGGEAMFEKIERSSATLQSTPYEALDIHFRLTFKPPKKPAPVEYSFWNDFLPGGRPESNRRKF